VLSVFIGEFVVAIENIVALENDPERGFVKDRYAAIGRKSAEEREGFVSRGQRAEDQLLVSNFADDVERRSIADVLHVESAIVARVYFRGLLRPQTLFLMKKLVATRSSKQILSYLGH
jgi:hypothetical protein